MEQLQQSYPDVTEDGYKPTTEESKALHYPLTNQEWLKVCQELKPAELMVLYHLRTLTPFGDRLLNLGVREIARTLNMSPSTVSRALKRLDQLGYIDLELIQVNVTIQSKGALFENNGVAYRQQALPTDNSVAYRQHLNDRSDLKPSQDRNLSFPQATNNKNIVKDFKKQKHPPTYPVFHRQESVGTSAGAVGQVVPAIEASGIQVNQSIQGAIQQTIEQFGEPTAVRRVENALAAVQEQMSRGKVPNPGGMLVTAIRRGFTPNQPPPSITFPPTPASPPVSSPPADDLTDLSDVLVGIQLHCERLGWTKEQAIAHMIDQHGWQPVRWSRIADSHLCTLLDELQRMET